MTIRFFDGEPNLLHFSMDVMTALEAARAPLTLDELREYCGAMFSDERLESLIRAGDVKPLEEVPNAYWAVPLALRKRSTARRLQSPMKSVERARLIESIVNLRAKLNSEAEELEALELRRDQMPTQEQLNEHMQRLHKYNENKDIGQELMGKLAEIEKEKVEVMYEKYGIELDD